MPFPFDPNAANMALSKVGSPYQLPTAMDAQSGTGQMAAAAPPPAQVTVQTAPPPSGPPPMKGYSNPDEVAAYLKATGQKTDTRSEMERYTAGGNFGAPNDGPYAGTYTGSDGKTWKDGKVIETHTPSVSAATNDPGTPTPDKPETQAAPGAFQQTGQAISDVAAKAADNKENAGFKKVGALVGTVLSAYTGNAGGVAGGISAMKGAS